MRCGAQARRISDPKVSTPSQEQFGWCVRAWKLTLAREWPSHVPRFARRRRQRVPRPRLSRCRVRACRADSVTSRPLRQGKSTLLMGNNLQRHPRAARCLGAALHYARRWPPVPCVAAAVPPCSRHFSAAARASTSRQDCKQCGCVSRVIRTVAGHEASAGTLPLTRTVQRTATAHKPASKRSVCADVQQDHSSIELYASWLC